MKPLRSGKEEGVVSRGKETGEPSSTVLRMLGNGSSPQEIKDLLGLDIPVSAEVTLKQLLESIQRGNPSPVSDTGVPQSLSSGREPASRVLPAFESHGHLLDPENRALLALQIVQKLTLHEITVAVNLRVPAQTIARLREAKKRLLAIAENIHPKEKSFEVV